MENNYAYLTVLLKKAENFNDQTIQLEKKIKIIENFRKKEIEINNKASVLPDIRVKST